MAPTFLFLRQGLSSPHWPGTHDVPKYDLEHLVLPTPPPKCRNYPAWKTACLFVVVVEILQPWLALNLKPPSLLSLSKCWDYRHTSPWSVGALFVKKENTFIVCVCVCTCGGQGANGSQFSKQVQPRNQTQVVRLGDKRLYPQNQLSSLITPRLGHQRLKSWPWEQSISVTGKRESPGPPA